MTPVTMACPEAGKYKCEKKKKGHHCRQLILVWAEKLATFILGYSGEGWLIF